MNYTRHDINTDLEMILVVNSLEIAGRKLQFYAFDACHKFYMASEQTSVTEIIINFHRQI